MNKTQTMDNFDEKYTPTTKIVSSIMDEETQVGMFETYGEDLKMVKEFSMKEPKKVFTFVDGEDGKSHLIAGFHSESSFEMLDTPWKNMCNPFAYMIVEEDFSDPMEDYILY